MRPIPANGYPKSITSHDDTGLSAALHLSWDRFKLNNIEDRSCKRPATRPAQCAHCTGMSWPNLTDSSLSCLIICTQNIMCDSRTCHTVVLLCLCFVALHCIRLHLTAYDYPVAVITSQHRIQCTAIPCHCPFWIKLKIEEVRRMGNMGVIAMACHHVSLFMFCCIALFWIASYCF